MQDEEQRTGDLNSRSGSAFRILLEVTLLIHLSGFQLSYFLNKRSKARRTPLAIKSMVKPDESSQLLRRIGVGGGGRNWR